MATIDFYYFAPEFFQKKDVNVYKKFFNFFFELLSKSQFFGNNPSTTDAVFNENLVSSRVSSPENYFNTPIFSRDKDSRLNTGLDDPFLFFTMELAEFENNVKVSYPYFFYPAFKFSGDLSAVDYIEKLKKENVSLSAEQIKIDKILQGEAVSLSEEQLKMASLNYRFSLHEDFKPHVYFKKLEEIYLPYSDSEHLIKEADKFKQKYDYLKNNSPTKRVKEFLEDVFEKIKLYFYFSYRFSRLKMCDSRITHFFIIFYTLKLNFLELFDKASTLSDLPDYSYN